MATFLRYLIFLGLVSAVAFWVLTRPAHVSDDVFAGLDGDAGRGETVFWAGGCASCHAAPDAKDEARLVLAGGYRMVSPFGTFVAPNISPAPEGLAGWSTADLGNALLHGTSPSGRHYYPAFPYTSYRHMVPQDIADLKAFLDTLPASDAVNMPHDVTFPFTVTRGIGLWKRLNTPEGWVLQDAATPEIERGRYLVEALGHCAECHTPRDVAGGLDRARWMAGAANPSGKGRIPGISPATLDWDATDIAYYLESGLTPDYDSAGGTMVSVIASLGHLTPEDRMAIAVYLKALP